MTPKRRPSASQRRVLLNMADGKPLAHELTTREQGSTNNVIASLIKRGWVDRTGTITAAGKAAVASVGT